jgi:hypothetical protein
MNEIKVPALKIEFIEMLLNRWYNDYQDRTVADFLSDIELEYGSDFQDYIVPGDTGVYIDSDAVFILNNSIDAGRGKAEWDKDSSRILFGEDGLTTLYSYDQDGNKMRLNAVQSSDIRIWNCLSLFILRGYTSKRWGVRKDTIRLFVNSLTNGKVSRHSIMRLYWSALICYDTTKQNKLELLDTLWKSQDFMTQVTERSLSGMSEQIRAFLEFCSKEENEAVFKEKSSEGYVKYRKFIKLLRADSNVLALTMMSDEEISNLLDENLVASV